MQGGEHQVAGQCRIDSILCRLLRSRLTDEDDIRIMPEDGFESHFIRISFRIIDLRLLDSFHLVFDRIFEGDDLPFSIVEITQDGIERRRLS